MHALRARADHNAPEGLALLFKEADLRKVIDDGSEEPGRNGKVEDSICHPRSLRAQSQVTADAVVRGRIINVACDVMKPVGEPGPRGVVELCRSRLVTAVRGEGPERLAQIASEFLIAPLHSVDTEDLEGRVERLLVREVVERRDQEPLGEVAGCAEDHQRARRCRRRADRQRAVSRQLYGHR
jgi:hypothetical protein